MTSFELFQQIPRMEIAPLQTPVHRCGRIETVVPGMPALYVKHDDYIGPLVWGNKLRKLEYVFAEARRLGADTLITCGGLQSNHARTTAHAALRFGFRVILVLNGVPPARPTGNLLIDFKIGAEVHFVSTREERQEKMEKLADDQRALGHKVLVIPLGASDEVGLPGFIRAMGELKQQQQQLGIKFDYIFHPSSSGGTQSGLEVGKRLFEIDPRIIGISADTSERELKEKIVTISTPVMKHLKMDPMFDEDQLSVDDRFIGEGYGIPTAASLEAEKLFSEQEGILVDHFYTAKAASAIIHYAREGFFKPDDRVLFWHTGGTISLFQ
ncbi:MAG: D-cysteine desulfhydrase family protein [Bacteroidales bacterium]|nr:D-cysteine desulfhydrase family protein [Bacteroidales bacterium]